MGGSMQPMRPADLAELMRLRRENAELRASDRGDMGSNLARAPVDPDAVNADDFETAVAAWRNPDERDGCE